MARVRELKKGKPEIAAFEAEQASLDTCTYHAHTMHIPCTYHSHTMQAALDAARDQLKAASAGAGAASAAKLSQAAGPLKGVRQ